MTIRISAEATDITIEVDEVWECKNISKKILVTVWHFLKELQTVLEIVEIHINTHTDTRKST